MTQGGDHSLGQGVVDAEARAAARSRWSGGHWIGGPGAGGLCVQGEVSHAVFHPAKIAPAAWARLTEKTIFFGHQSVGCNIIDGIREVASCQSPPVTVRIVETKNATQIDGPMLAHALIGRNLDPASKIAEFQTLVEGGIGEKVDIALFKLCYVDIGVDAKPEAIFATYCEAMNSLKSRFSQVTFVHVTVPLCSPPRTMKGIVEASVKRLIGWPSVLDANRVRARYNTLLREKLAGNEPLFDLALYESLKPDGLRQCNVRNGQEVPGLVPAYTDDGGHLNGIGRRHVAGQLLTQLSGLCAGSV